MKVDEKMLLSDLPTEDLPVVRTAVDRIIRHTATARAADHKQVFLLCHWRRRVGTKCLKLACKKYAPVHIDYFKGYTAQVVVSGVWAGTY